MSDLKKNFSDDIRATLPELAGITQTCGNREVSGLRFGIVSARFNEKLTEALVETSVECLREHGVADADIEIFWVPGAYELPLVIQELASTSRFDALIALGAVIKGSTPHADLITSAVCTALSEISRQFHLPVIDTVVGTNNLPDAETRCLTGRESRGWYAALAAIEMATLMKSEILNPKL